MVKVEFNNKTNNPFTGMYECLKLYQNRDKQISTYMLREAYLECDTDEKKEMFLALVFSIGDITGRNHYLFEGAPVDTGGFSARENFRDVVIPFLLKNFSKKKVIPLIAEYTVMDNLYAVRTKSKKGKAIAQIDMISLYGVNKLAKYTAGIILKGTEFQKACVAKFLTRYRSRHGDNKNSKKELLRKICLLLGWEFQGNNFSGYYKWRKPYVEKLESHKFSNFEVTKMNKEEFIHYLGTQPNSARHRIKSKIKNQDKWPNLKQWFEEWEAGKEKAQTIQRELETKVQEGVATVEEKKKLKKVKKAAKVHTAGMSFSSAFKSIVTGTIDKVAIQPFLDQFDLPYNTLVFVDDSGSMNMRQIQGFTARDFAAFMATVCLMYNPDVEARTLIGLFSRTCKFIAGVDKTAHKPNSLINATITRHIAKPLIDSRNHFLKNYNGVKQFLNANSTGMNTNVASIGRAVADWCSQNPANIDWLAQYPVWTLISDGNFNQRANVTASMNQLMQICRDTIGFEPFVIIIDVAYDTSAKIEELSGIPNVIFVPPNPAEIKLLLTNFRDMQTADGFLPLQQIHASNRYVPVRRLVR